MVNVVAATTNVNTASTTPARTLTLSEQIPQPQHLLALQQWGDARSADRQAKKDRAATHLSRFCAPPVNLSAALVTESQRLFNRATDTPHYARRDIDGTIAPYEYREEDMNGVLGACVYLAQINLGMSLGASSNTNENGTNPGREGGVGLSIPQICEAAQCHANEIARWSWLIQKPSDAKGQERRVPEGPGMGMMGMMGEMGEMPGLGSSTVNGGENAAGCGIS